MAPNPRRLAERLDALYERIPKMECKGLCSDACGPIAATAAEEDRLRRATGRALDFHMTPNGPRCGFLDATGRCSAYEARPAVCRLWGATEGMPCTHGCLEGDPLPDDQAFEILAEARAISGMGLQSRKLLEVMQDPEVRAAVLAIARRGQHISMACPTCARRLETQFGKPTLCSGCGATFIPEFTEG